jgi:hypothetical protein
MYIGEVDDVFRIAEMQVYEEKMKKPQEPRIVKMPTIGSNPNIEGPLKVTQEFKDEWKREQARLEAIKKRNEQRITEEKLLKLFAKRKFLKLRLNDLNPDKYKNIPKITGIKIQIKDTEDQIREIQEKSGIKFEDIDNDSPLRNFWEKITQVTKKIVKKVKKFIKKHSDVIEGIFIAAISTISILFFIFL